MNEKVKLFIKHATSEEITAFVYAVICKQDTVAAVKAGQDFIRIKKVECLFGINLSDEARKRILETLKENDELRKINAFKRRLEEAKQRLILNSQQRTKQIIIRSSFSSKDKTKEE